MKPIPIGTSFVIPLPNDQYGFGYVVFEGEALFVNIADKISNNYDDIDTLNELPLLLQDYLMDWSSFRRRSYYLYPNLILKRNKVIANPPAMLNPWVILGGGNALNVVTNEQHLASPEEKAKYPMLQFSHSDEAYRKLCTYFNLSVTT